MSKLDRGSSSMASVSQQRPVADPQRRPSRWFSLQGVVQDIQRHHSTLSARSSTRKKSSEVELQTPASGPMHSAGPMRVVSGEGSLGANEVPPWDFQQFSPPTYDREVAPNTMPWAPGSTLYPRSAVDTRTRGGNVSASAEVFSISLPPTTSNGESIIYGAPDELSDLLECPLCELPQSRDCFPVVSTCQHRACADCMKQYLTIEITESR